MIEFKKGKPEVVLIDFGLAKKLSVKKEQSKAFEGNIIFSSLN